MTAQLVVICQAPTAGTRAAAFPADEAADAQSLARSSRLIGSIGRCHVCSTAPARAARQTAAVLALPTVVEPALRDCDYGRWAGRTFVDVMACEPDGIATWISTADSRPHGGETIVELIERCATWLDGFDLLGRTAAVVPASVVKGLVITAIGAPPSAFFRLDLAPLSVTRMRRSGAGWTLVSLNERLAAGAGG